jgi:hypothetical protein
MALTETITVLDKILSLITNNEQLSNNINAIQEYIVNIEMNTCGVFSSVFSSMFGVLSYFNSKPDTNPLVIDYTVRLIRGFIFVVLEKSPETIVDLVCNHPDNGTSKQVINIFGYIDAIFSEPDKFVIKDVYEKLFMAYKNLESIPIKRANSGVLNSLMESIKLGLQKQEAKQKQLMNQSGLEESPPLQRQLMEDLMEEEQRKKQKKFHKRKHKK